MNGRRMTWKNKDPVKVMRNLIALFNIEIAIGQLAALCH